MKEKKDIIDFDSLIEKYTKPILLISVGVFVSATILFMINRYFNSDIQASSLGDFLGGYLGAGLSILTVLLLYQTYLSQKSELALQRKELERQKLVLESQLQETKYSRILNSVYIELDVLSKIVDEFIRKTNEIEFKTAKFATPYINLFYYKNSLKGIGDIYSFGEMTQKCYEEYFYNIYDNDGYELCLKIKDCCYNLSYLINTSNDKETLKTIIANRIGVTFFHIATESIQIIEFLSDDTRKGKLNVVLNCLKTVKEYHQYSLRVIENNDNT